MPLVQKKSRNLSVFTQYKENTYELFENDVNEVLKNSISSCIKSIHFLILTKIKLDHTEVHSYSNHTVNARASNV